MNALATINILLEIFLVMRLWRVSQRAYAGFAIYIAISTLASSALLALSMATLAPQYRAFWIVMELLMAIPGGWVSFEAIRELRRVGKHLPDAITVLVALCIMGSLVAWGYSHYGYNYDQNLEFAFSLKATVELFFCAMLVGMLVSGHIPNRLHSLEFRHGLLLAGYFGLNSFTFYGYGLASARGTIQNDYHILSLFLLLTCTACLIGWLFLFGRRARQS